MLEIFMSRESMSMYQFSLPLFIGISPECLFHGRPSHCPHVLAVPISLSIAMILALVKLCDQSFSFLISDGACPHAEPELIPIVTARL